MAARKSRRATAGTRARKKSTRPSGRSSYAAAWLWALLALALVATVFWIRGWGDAAQDQPTPQASAAVKPLAPNQAKAEPGAAIGLENEAVNTSEPSAASPGSTDVAESPDAPATRGEGVYLALVIDDLGRSLDDVRRLHALDASVSYAVLPFESKTSEVVQLLESLGSETLLHLPMEAKGPQNPGPGALMLSMDLKEVEAATQRALAAVGNVGGANNHMGSAFTEDQARMEIVIGELRKRGLFFLDSRTSPKSVGFDLARSVGVPAAERSVFLDNDDSVAAIRAQFRQFLRDGRESGAAIAIGHPYDSTLSVLEREVARAKELGYEFVPVSALLERSGGDI